MKPRNVLPPILVTMLLVWAGSGCDKAPTVAIRSPGQSRQPSVTSAGGTVDSDFDDIKFEMEPTDEFRRAMLTEKVEKLFGRRIRIRGYIFPTLKKRGLKQFVLVRDNLECCCGPGAALYDCILVHMQTGHTAEFSIRPVAVEGSFSFEEFRDFDNVVRAIYRLDADLVE